MLGAAYHKATILGPEIHAHTTISFYAYIFPPKFHPLLVSVAPLVFSFSELLPSSWGWKEKAKPTQQTCISRDTNKFYGQKIAIYSGRIHTLAMTPPFFKKKTTFMSLDFQAL